MDLNKFVKGSCDDFCPRKESNMRTVERLLHFYELNPPIEYDAKVGHLPVKCFGRSAAGTETPKSSNLRTFNSLHRTVEYLLKYILTDKRKPFHFKYDFIFDRLRAVRQDFVIQNLNGRETVKLIEPIVMFLSFSSYELCECPISIFDPKICNQHLQEFLQKLLCSYDEIDEKYGEKSTVYLPNREFCECLYVVFNLGNVDSINRGIHLRSSIRGKLFEMCLDISLQCFIGNYHKAIKSIKSLPQILCGLAMPTLQKLRREILLRFSVAYHSKMSMIPTSWLADLLLYDNEQLLVADCKYYNIEISTDSQQIKFNKFNFDPARKMIQPRHEMFADVKLLPRRISDILLFKEKITIQGI